MKVSVYDISTISLLRTIMAVPLLIIIIIIIEGLSLLQSIPPTTADKQTQAQKRRGSRSRKLLGAKALLMPCAYACLKFTFIMAI